LLRVHFRVEIQLFPIGHEIDFTIAILSRICRRRRARAEISTKEFLRSDNSWQIWFGALCRRIRASGWTNRCAAGRFANQFACVAAGGCAGGCHWEIWQRGCGRCARTNFEQRRKQLRQIERRLNSVGPEQVLRRLFDHDGAASGKSLPMRRSESRAAVKNRLKKGEIFSEVKNNSAPRTPRPLIRGWTPGKFL